jgi:CheY-like chemotaxis protein
MNALARSTGAGPACLRARRARWICAPAPGLPGQRGPDTRPIRAVVVDDSPFILKLLSTLLEEQNNVQLVGTAMDGRHAVRRVTEEAPDLVLMDLQLPGLNGLEATRQIKAHPQPPAVIIVTADDTPAYRAAARDAGADAFVGKQQLFTHLRSAINKLFPWSNH